MSKKSKLEQAALEFVLRQDRKHHPDGKFDNGGRWYPSETERCECCDHIRYPSRAYPYSLMVHCRTAKHVASLYGVDVKALKREAKRIRAEMEAEA